jgi:hypothetical protein
MINSIKITPIALVTLLSACSQNSTLSKLQSEYDNYKYSSYVVANLKREKAENIARSRANDSFIQISKASLKSRKTQHDVGLKSAVTENGLYQPSPAIKQQIAKIKDRRATENVLSRVASLELVIALAIKNNLDIKSAQQQAWASLEKYDQVSFLDDMLSQYAIFTKDIQLTGSNQQHRKPISKAFPFPGLSALKSSIIDQSVESSRLQLKQQVQDVITQTRIAYFELQFAEQEIKLTQKNTALLKSLKEELQNSYSTNTGELSGILSVDIEIATSENNLQLAKDKRKIQQARINALLNLSPTFTLGKLDRLRSEKLAGNSADYIITAKSRRAEILLLESELEKMKRIIKLSEKRFYPDFDAGYSRFQDGKFTTKPKFKNSNFFAKNDAYLNETKQKYKALQAKVAALKNTTADEIQQALSNYQSQKSSRALYQNKVLPKAKSSLEVAKNLYETGGASIVNVINAEKIILNYRLLTAKALKEMNINKAKLMRLVGVEKN